MGEIRGFIQVAAAAGADAAAAYRMRTGREPIRGVRDDLAAFAWEDALVDLDIAGDDACRRAFYAGFYGDDCYDDEEGD